MLSNWRTPVIAIAIAMVSYVLIKGYNAYSDHWEYVSTLETDNQTLTEDKNDLNDQVSNMTVAIRQQQQENDELVAELERRRLQQVANEQKERELEEQINKQKQETSDAIKHLTKQLQQSGFRDLRLPDDVIRMQRERAEEVNRRASGSDKDGGTSKAGGKSVPAVPNR